MKKNEVLDLELELTTLCNARCQLCFRNYKEYDERYPINKSRGIKDIKEQLDEYVSLEWIRLVGTISEPTLYKDFYELIKYIKDRGINIEICTNGDTHNEKWWSELSTYMNSNDRVYFTICGSTQELHEIYREGTRLKNILANASAFRSEDKNDYAQCIRFSYNDRDFNSDNFKGIVSEFSNIYMTETYLSKDDENYKKQDKLRFLTPVENKKEMYEKIDKLAKIGLSNVSYCKSWEHKSQQVDINGNIYPCYLYLEQMGDKKWDGDYEKVLSQQYNVCRYCEKNVMKLCMKKGLEYII